jgi:ribonuclease Z
MASKIKVTFLGTSAQIPSPRRNHTAILLTYNQENILVDCGEGTQTQFRKAKINPGKITKILITHIHGDHTFGLPGLLNTLSFSEYNKTLHIYGPKGFKEFMKEFLNMFKIERNFKIEVHEITQPGLFFKNEEFELHAEKMQHGIPANAYFFKLNDKIRINKEKIQKLKINDIENLKKLKQGKDITHNKKNYKNSQLTYLEQGKKVSFVLDTLYNDKIIPFAVNSDLLICDSSFSSHEKDLAKEHLHLTSEQDAIIAKKSHSKKLILTHISQKYENKTKELLEDAKKHFKDVKVAKDLDEVII